MDIDPAELERRFAELAEASHEQRAEALRALQAESPELAQRLALLLDAHEATRNPLDQLHGETLRHFATFEPEALVGRALGDWTLVRVIGHGGMGVVYEARSERDSITQEAAIKLLAAPLFNRHAAERFVQEARVLARLDHPGICRLRDWGHSPEGWPYLVLDLVRGEPLPADGGGRPLRDRLATMARIADAVAAAHRQLVAHLDLKPANVLMTADRGPVLLDFGISRVLNEDDVAGGTLTRWLTPAYASPEQLRGEPVSAATDLYALGVMLYEQATGRPPFDFGNASVTESLRRIEQGAVPPGKAAPGLPRDLDAICACAMHPDPRRRYASADAFADDLRALLERRPVSARPDRLGYRLSRALARHPVALPAGVLAVAAVVTLAILLAFQASDLRQQRDRAEAAARRASSATGLLLGAIKSVDPVVGDAKLTLSDYLDKVADRLNHSDEKSPSVYAEALIQLADVRRSQAQYGSAVDLYRHAQNLLGQKRADNDPTHTAKLRHDANIGLIEALRGTGQVGQSLQLAYRLLATPEGKDDWEYELVAARGELTQMHLDKAEALFRQAIARIPRDQPIALSKAYQGLAFVVSSRGHDADALDWLKKAQSVLGNQPEAKALRASQLDDEAWSESELGHHKEALLHIRQAVDMRVQIYGEAHPDVAQSLNDQMMIQNDAGDYEQAIATGKRAMAIETKLGEKESRRAERIYSTLGTSYKNLDRYEEAREMQSEALRIAEKLYPVPNITTANDHMNLASVLADMGNCKDSLTHSEEAYRIYTTQFHDKPSRQAAIVASNMSECLRQLGHNDAALRWSLTAYREARQVMPAGDWRVATIHNVYAENLLAAGHVAEAETEAKAVEAAFAAAGKTARPSAVRDNQGLLAKIYKRKGDHQLAEKYQALATAP
jgi:serine/threonine-protein kinase